MLEAAFAKFWGDFEDIGTGGNRASAWTTLTGKGTTWIWTSGNTAAEVRQHIEDALADGDAVIFSTKDSFAGKQTTYQLASGQTLIGDHDYVVTETSAATGTVLWNPYGGDPQNPDIVVTLTDDELESLSIVITILYK